MTPEAWQLLYYVLELHSSFYGKNCCYVSFSSSWTWQIWPGISEPWWIRDSGVCCHTWITGTECSLKCYIRFTHPQVDFSMAGTLNWPIRIQGKICLYLKYFIMDCKYICTDQA